MPFKIGRKISLFALLVATATTGNVWAQDPASDAQTRTGKKVALRTSTGYYITAEDGGGASVHTDRQALGPWETFTMLSVAPGIFAFRSDNGSFLSLSDLSGSPERPGRAARTMLTATKKQLDASTQFKMLVVNPDNWTVALITSTGKYVTAENNGGVKARGAQAISTDRTEIGDWEQFQLVDVDKQARPAR